MLGKLLSLMCCCLPTITSVRHKRRKHQRTTFIISCPSSTSCHLSPIVIPCTPTTSNSSQHPLYEDSLMTSTDDSSTFITDDTSSSSHPVSNSSSPRVSAIRELIETEQRYVTDLRLVANDFIKPLRNNRVINDHEIEQLFSNWFNIIACNTVLLSSLQEQVHYRELPITVERDEHHTRTLRSVSMSHIALSEEVRFEPIRNSRHVSQASLTSRTTTDQQSKHHTQRRRSPSPIITIPPSSHSPTSTMSINESTEIGEILCSYLPYMGDVYFHYCNGSSQANKELQIKTDSHKQFRNYVKLFQNENGGLSLNGFLTKPMQRVTRYPLLIEKILRHTPINHSDHLFVQQAHERALQLTDRINKQIAEQENRFRLDWLQQHVIFGTDEYSADGYVFDEFLKFNSSTKLHKQRKLLLHGLIAKVPSGRELAAFLFNDFLLLCIVKSSSNNWETQLFESKSSLQLKVYRSPYFLTDVVNITEPSTDRFSFSIITNTHSKPLSLRTEPPNVRTLWVRSIMKAVEECRALEMSIPNDLGSLSTTTDNEDQSKTALARLNLVVNDANIISLLLTKSPTTSPRHRNINPYCQITVGSSTLKTPFIKRTNRPKWHFSMQFLLYNFIDDKIQIDIFDHEFFSSDENIDSTSIYLPDILPCPLDVFRNQPSHSFTQAIYLKKGSSINLKCMVEFLSPDE